MAFVCLPLHHELKWYKMKKSKALKGALIMLTAACVFASCQKEAFVISGNYSFKGSGTCLVVTDTSATEVALVDEIGSLDIIHNGNEEVVLTFNTMNGPVYYTTATVEGSTLRLNDYSRTAGIAAESYDLLFKGSAVRYDKSIVFDLTFKGESCLRKPRH